MPVREDRAEPAYGILFTSIVLIKSYAGKFKIFLKSKEYLINFSNNF